MKTFLLPDRVQIEDDRFYRFNIDDLRASLSRQLKKEQVEKQIKEFQEKFPMFTNGKIFILPGKTTVHSVGLPAGVGLINWYKKNTEYSCAMELAHAAKFGTFIHDSIEMMLRGEVVNITRDNAFARFGTVRVCDAMEGFMNFAADWGLKVEEPLFNVEKVVINLPECYAGTMDCEGFVVAPKGVRGSYKKGQKLRARIDWKTSKDVYLSHKIQLTDYDRACYTMGDGLADVLLIVQLGSKGKRKYKVHTITDPVEKVEYRLLSESAHRFFMHNYSGKEFTDMVKREVPTELHMGMVEDFKEEV